MKQFLAQMLKKTGMRLIRFSRRFEPQGDVAARERKVMADLFASAKWEARLNKLSDHDLANVLAERFDMPLGTQDEVVIGEAIFRLNRANGGHTDYDPASQQPTEPTK